MASVVVCAAFAVAGIGVSRNGDMGSLWDTAVWLGIVLLGAAATRVAIRRWAPNSNEILFGVVGLLIGIGWVFVVRIDPALAQGHTFAVLAGFAALVGTLVAMARLDWFMQHPGACGLIAAVLAGLGSFASGIDVSGGAYDPARQWLSLGSLNVQPYGVAKLGVILAACGLTVTAPRWLPARLVPHRHAVGAIVAAVGAWTLLLAQGDLSSSVLIFAAAWLPLWLDGDDLVGSELPTVARSTRTRALGGVIATYGVGVIVLASVYDWLSAQMRHWQDPWTVGEVASTVEAAFAISAGGISGVGPGLGAPQRIAAVHSDFVFAVITEELGILGGAALLAAFMLLIGVGAGIAQRARNTHRLLAATATAVIGLQALATIAGVLRLLPHTVGALPFVAHGPVALVGNCIAVAMLLAISDVSGSLRLEQSAPRASEPTQLRMPRRLDDDSAAGDAPTGELRAAIAKPARRRRRPASDPSQGEPQQLPLGDP
ncbi:FtsW/RodA/SpoVE family cell cycle protein [Candidatus Poriferisodalis sp.]|uniref:FtsW/RodA/SpoVE family cell cycle protein n=1 Tax=Candidatus Poriferisodalis sp. TaxID=3101277 RepID=UPI003C6FB193